MKDIRRRRAAWRSWPSRVAFALLLAATIAISGFGWANRYFIGVEIASDHNDSAQFYLNDGLGLREGLSVVFNIAARRSPTYYVAQLPRGTFSDVRFDPVRQPGEVSITRIWIFDGVGVTLHDFDLSGAYPLKDMTVVERGKHVLSLRTPPLAQLLAEGRAIFVARESREIRKLAQASLRESEDPANVATELTNTPDEHLQNQIGELLARGLKDQNTPASAGNADEEKDIEARLRPESLARRFTEYAKRDLDPMVHIYKGRLPLTEPLAARALIGGAAFVVIFALLTLLGMIPRFSPEQAGAAVRRNARTISVLAFVWLVQCFLIAHFSTDIFASEPYSEVINFWAANLANGRLDLPPGALGGEAIKHAGREFSYIGIWPPVFRLLISPFVSVVGGSIGKLVSAGLCFAYLSVVVLLVRFFAARAPTALTHRQVDLASAIAICGLGLGTCLLIFIGRSYAYHETILWSLVAGVFGIYFLLKYLDHPNWRYVLAFVIVAAIGSYARPTAIIGFATMGAGIGLIALWRDFASASKSRKFVSGGLIAAGGGLCIVVAGIMAVTQARFGGPFTFVPLDWHYGHPFERLAHFGGASTPLSDMPDRLARYFGIPGIDGERRFPFLGFIVGSPGHVRDDIIEPYIGVWVAMCGALVLAAIGALGGGFRRLRLDGWVLTICSIAPAFLILTFVGVSFRYVLEFLPAATLVACAGAAAIGVRHVRLAVALLALSFVVQWQLSLRFQGEVVWGVPDSFTQRYAEMTGLSFDDVYGGFFVDPREIEDVGFGQRKELAAFLTMRRHTMLNHVEATTDGGAVVRHSETGLALPLPEGQCVVRGRALRPLLDTTGTDLPWLGFPMAATTACGVDGASSGFPEGLTIMMRPTTLPQDPQRYFAQFRRTVADLCQTQNCAVKNAVMPARPQDGWGYVIQAGCDTTSCSVLRYSSRGYVHGLIALTVAVVKGQVVYVYNYAPISLLSGAFTNQNAQALQKAHAVSMQRFFAINR